MSKGNSALMGVGLVLGTLVIGGAAVGGFFLFRKPAAAAVGSAPAPIGSGLIVGNGVSATVGSASAGWNAQQAIEAERLRELAWRRTDAINRLERELATCQNEIKLLTDQLNVIDNTPMSQEHIVAWSNAHYMACRSAFVFGFGCEQRREITTEGWDVKALDDWKAKQAALRRPILTRLSALNSQQLSIIQNLRELGVTKQPVNVRTT